MASGVDMLANALSGASGSALAKCVTYPFESIKTSCMAKQPHQSTADVIAGISNRGWYAGLKPKISKSVTQKFIYFYLYEALSQLQRRATGGTAPSTAQSLLIGYLSEVFGIPAFAPLETITVQAQLSGDSMSQVARGIMQRKGWAGFFTSIDGYMLGAIQPSIQFTLYERMKAQALNGARPGACTGSLSVGQAFWMAAVAKFIAQTITYPFNLGRTRVQSGREEGSCNAGGDMTADDKGVLEGAGHAPTTLRPPTVLSVLARVLSEEGVSGMFEGWLPDVIQGVCDAALMMMAKESTTRAVTTAVHAVLGNNRVQ